MKRPRGDTLFFALVSAFIILTALWALAFVFELGRSLPTAVGMAVTYGLGIYGGRVMFKRIAMRGVSTDGHR